MRPPPGPRRKSQWPVVQAVAVIIGVAVILTALQLHGEMGDFRHFLDRDLSKGLPVYRSYPVSSEFKVNRVMKITSLGGDVTYSGSIAIPKSIAGEQEVVELGTSPTPTTTSATFWTWSGTLHSGQNYPVVISYHIKATLRQWKLTADDSGTASQVPAGYSGYLTDCWKFTPSDPTIKDLAAQLAGGTTNAYEKVSDIYEYMVRNIRYQSSTSEPKWPTKCLSDGNGDCDDQSFLMGSLLRAQGIPAWMELGILYDSSKRAWGGHAWLQVFIPDKGGGGQLVNIDPANDEFLFRDAYRLTDYIDDGNAGNLQAYYVTWHFTSTHGSPLLEDRYDSIEFSPSDATVQIESSLPGPGVQALGQLLKTPGFECNLVVLAGLAIAVLVGMRRRREP